MDQAREEESGGASNGRPGRLVVGKRVSFYSESDKKTKCGVLRYFGEPEFAPGYWCGVELDQPEGRNNGSLQGIRYFSCDEGCGVFVPLSKVELETGNKPKPKLQPAGADRQKIIGAGRLLPDVAGKPRKTSVPRATAAGGSGTGGRKPLKAFSLQDKQHGFPPTPLASKVRTIVPRAASSENLRAMSHAASGGAKKSSSERDLRKNGGARTPDSTRATPVGIHLPSSSRQVRSSSFSSFSQEFPASSRTPSRSSVVSGPAFTDSYFLSPYEGQSRAISPASARDACASASHFSLGEVVALRDLVAQKSPPSSSYNLSNPSSMLSSGGEETGTSVETSHMGGSYLYFSWDGSPVSDKVKPQDAHDALVHRLMDPMQSVSA